MYIYIGHDRSVYRGLFREEIMHRIDIETAMIDYDLKHRVRPFPARWWVGHDYFLVLVFAATPRQLALPTNQRGS